MKAIDIEIAVSKYLNFRTNLIVPNVHWGMMIHECDLLVITKAGYAWEIEIKVSRADLINDKKKKHRHKSDKIKWLYFAIPECLVKDIEHIPERAGIIVVKEKHYAEYIDGKRIKTPYLGCDILRSPKTNCNYKFSEEERYAVARLGAMRIWGLKEKLK